MKFLIAILTLMFFFLQVFFTGQACVKITKWNVRTDLFIHSIEIFDRGPRNVIAYKRYNRFD